MPKSVARASDVSASAGQGVPTEAQKGTWTPPPAITTKTYDKLVVGGAPAIYSAEGVFSFSGTDSSGNAPYNTTSKVTLTAASTKLQGAENGVLVDGDSAQDQYGNTISVSSSSKARSD